MNRDQAEKSGFLSGSRLREIVLLTSLATTMLSTAVLRADEPELLRPQWFDVIRVSGAADAHPLVLAQVDRINPPAFGPNWSIDEIRAFGKQVEKILPKGANLKSFTDPIGNMAFVLFRPRAGLSSKDLEGEQVAGIVYTHSFTDFPGHLWTGCLVHSRPMEQTYLVLARSQPQTRDLTLAIFPVDPERKIGTWPLKFPKAKVDSWPKPLQAVTEKMITLGKVFGIREIIAVPDEKTLVISAQLAEGNFAPYYFRYDFENKTWSTAKVVKGEPIK